jgi:hypothetical protein
MVLNVEASLFSGASIFHYSFVKNCSQFAIKVLHSLHYHLLEPWVRQSISSFFKLDLMFTKLKTTYAEFPSLFWIVVGTLFIDSIGSTLLFPFL